MTLMLPEIAKFPSIELLHKAYPHVCGQIIKVNILPCEFCENTICSFGKNALILSHANATKLGFHTSWCKRGSMSMHLWSTFPEEQMWLAVDRITPGRHGLLAVPLETVKQFIIPTKNFVPLFPAGRW